MSPQLPLFWIIAILALGALVFTVKSRIGFAAQNPRDYAGSGPRFDVATHLNGPIVCEGVIFGPRGRVESRFVARMKGNWTELAGTLDEDFTYSTGTTQHRQWRLRIVGENRFVAEADDIVGQAMGEISGASARMTYRIRLPDQAGGHVLAVTDWLYLTANGTIINRSQMRKCGIKVAELVATMRPDPLPAGTDAAE